MTAVVDAFGGAFGAAFGPAFGWSIDEPETTTKPTHSGRVWVGGQWEDEDDDPLATIEDALDYLNRKPKLTKAARAKIKAKIEAARKVAEKAAAEQAAQQARMTAQAARESATSALLRDLPPLPDLDAQRVSLVRLRAWFVELRARISAFEDHKRAEDEAALFLLLMDD